MTSLVSTSPGVPTLAPPAASPASPATSYRLTLATDAAQLRAAQALRFMVFNLEMNEGLARSYETGLDADRFDAACDHLLVEDGASGEVVGTYRLQTGARAAAGLGYYSEREFDFSPFEAARGDLIGTQAISAQEKQRTHEVIVRTLERRRAEAMTRAGPPTLTP